MQNRASFFAYLFLFMVCFSTAYGQDEGVTDSIFYAFNEPDGTCELNHQLMEISGLSTTPNPDWLCAVQDETGVLYFINKFDGKIVKKSSFRLNGDFEGVEFVDSTAYAVKSNGDIYCITNWDKEKPSVESYNTPLSKKDDIEGLGYFAPKNYLLLACKGHPESPKDRMIFAFSLDTKELIETPFFQINPIDVECALGKKHTDGDDCFSPSAIAVHPITGEYYMLSAARKRLVILDKNGQMIYAEKIKKKVLPQPEGICFEADGTLYISSEGKKEKKVDCCVINPVD